MQTDQRVEEETVPNYNPSRYYPVQIRDIFQDRYEVLGKLGYDATSTTWFCRDHHAENFKVLKICIHESGRPLREQHAYSQFSGLRTSNIGYWFTRLAKKRFEMTGPSGFPHACFVFAPAACTIEEILKYHDGPINMDFVKSTLRCAIRALDFLHSDAHLIHTDVKLDNMFMTLTDDAELEALAWYLAENPPEFKVDETGRKIYEQHNLSNLGSSSWGHAILGDLGEAYVFEEDKNDGLLGPSIVGPAALRPPEVILGMKWGTPLDTWQIGCLFFMLLNKRIPFNNLEGEERWSGCYHLTQTTALMGPPPPDYLARSEEQYLDCDETCAWGNPGSKGVPDVSFEALLERLEGEDKVNALDFVGRIFRWKPEERSTAKELLEHPFFDFEGTGAEENSANETDAEETDAEETTAEETTAEETTAEEASAEEMSSEKKGPISQCTDSETFKDCTDISDSQKPSKDVVASPDTLLETQDAIDAGGESQQASIHSRKVPGSKAPIKEKHSGKEPTEAPKKDESEDSKEEPEQIAADAKKVCDGEVVGEPRTEPLQKLAGLQIGLAESLQEQ
ncbi:hypothetical protein KC318_g4608 [Hortaea werneckii]|uniref:Protein kinase domain-containing protein n=1 Tax=Hortaea werneckii TaxID=91943 RepID=A0A3M7B1J7_HORWE|nr:hypothetical protein KC334_g6779 [Hortaea werneckii]KAI7009280.1 hypothetical protein KC355_g6616 [Hortaea werneckii]KAI7669511.1 hypothetical protein KC318_g4608 [Hortaea werneckii]RMY21984.1 hypothetical protein D0867_02998 [Hortaea werneckii]RMY33400.1 hypothetical protein D0866_05946 [Hortaea werneckii]